MTFDQEHIKFCHLIDETTNIHIKNGAIANIYGFIFSECITKAFIHSRFRCFEDIFSTCISLSIYPVADLIDFVMSASQCCCQKTKIRGGRKYVVGLCKYRAKIEQLPLLNKESTEFSEDIYCFDVKWKSITWKRRYILYMVMMLSMNIMNVGKYKAQLKPDPLTDIEYYPSLEMLFTSIAWARCICIEIKREREKKDCLQILLSEIKYLQ